MATSPFRRSTQTETKKFGGKGGRGNWREQYRLPKAAPTPFVLINGDYVDPSPAPELVEIDLQTGQPKPVKVAYQKWLKHRRKTVNKNTGKQRFLDAPCARGWDPHNPQSCAGCAAMDAGDKTVTRGEAYSLGIVHLAYYHRHPLVDFKTNQFIMKKDNSGPVMVDSECLGKQCNFCRWLSGQPPILQQGEVWPQYDPKTISTIYGSRRYLELGSGHLGNLGEWDKQIAARCGGTAYARNPQGQPILDAQGQPVPIGRCNNFLDIDGYACSVCGNMLINAEQDPRPVEQLEALALQKYPCHHCQRPVFLKEINSCSICGPTVVQGIFDGIIWGQRQGEDAQSHLVLVEFNTIAEFESKLPPETRQLIGKPLQDRINELAKPYDFAELNKPRSFEDTAKRLDLQIGPAANPGYPGGYQPPMGYPGAQPGYGYPPAAPPQQQFYGAQPGMPQQAPQQPMGYPPPAAPSNGQPAYTPYAAPTGPGPAPFVPPAKPNFGG